MALHPAWNRTRVTKKYAPSQPGARKLARRYGAALVCVRHRHNLEGTVRYTTVELMVEEVPIGSRTPRGQLLAVRLHRGDPELRHQVIANGGRWDRALGAWWVTRGTATRLRLMDRVVAVDAAG
jgi:hypothetical protein